jgi:hypothetical protein
MPVTIWSSMFCLHFSYPKIERLKFAELSFWLLFYMDLKLVCCNLYSAVVGI